MGVLDPCGESTVLEPLVVGEALKASLRDGSGLTRYEERPSSRVSRSGSRRRSSLW